MNFWGGFEKSAVSRSFITKMLHRAKKKYPYMPLSPAVTSKALKSSDPSTRYGALRDLHLDSAYHRAAQKHLNSGESTTDAIGVAEKAFQARKKTRSFQNIDKKYTKSLRNLEKKSS